MTIRKFRTHCVKHHRLYSLLFLASTTLLITACSTAWVSDASSIIALLGPAIEAATGILTAFGLGLSPDVLAAFQKWAAEAQAALTNVVGPLITQYTTASATAQPGILGDISTALSVISSNLATILPTIKVTNPTRQNQIYAIVMSIANEITALIGLVPALQGKITSGEELEALITKLDYKHPKQFKKLFNERVADLGPEASKFQLK
jgi:hypothetical protein